MKSNSQIILYGESLGTGIAVEMAKKNNFNSIISKVMRSNGFDVTLGKCMTMILDFLADAVDLPYFVIHIFAEYRQSYYIG